MKKTIREILEKYHWETVRFCNLKITTEEFEKAEDQAEDELNALIKLTHRR